MTTRIQIVSALTVVLVGLGLGLGLRADRNNLDGPRAAPARHDLALEFAESGNKPVRHDLALEFVDSTEQYRIKTEAAPVEVAPAPRRVCRAYVSQVVPPTGREYAEVARVARAYGHNYEVDGVSVVAHKRAVQVLQAGDTKVDYHVVVVLIGDTAYAVVVELDGDVNPFAESRAAEVAVRYFRSVGPYPGSSVGPEPLGPDGRPMK